MTGRFSAAALRDVLEAHVPLAATGLVVAVSGGFDSTCLLTALAQLGAPPLRKLSVRALHVDHGLQPAAGSFREACAELCRRLEVPLTVVQVQVAARRGESIEAAARDARYQGIARELRAGECVLTAHHAADQAETVLLQLLRGAGAKGLAAMPVRRRLGQGWHVRPLLRFAQHELREFGGQMGIQGHADPMNADPRFDRVYLRTHVWPLLRRAGPAVKQRCRAARGIWPTRRNC